MCGDRVEWFICKLVRVMWWFASLVLVPEDMALLRGEVK